MNVCFNIVSYLAIVDMTGIVPDMADFGIGGEVYVPPYKKFKRKRASISEPVYTVESMLGGGAHRHQRPHRPIPTRASTPNSELGEPPQPDEMAWVASPEDRAPLGFDEVDNNDDSGLISQ